MNEDKKKPAVVVKIRDSFEAQLPLVAAILATAYEDFDPKQSARDAIALVIAIEEQL